MKKSLQIHILLFLSSCVFILIYSFSASPLYLNCGGDSSIFSVIGLGIVQGKLPYVDLFDHKGPLLFYIFALAKWISYTKLGLYVVSICFLYFTLFLQYRISLLYVGDRKAVFSLIIPLIFLAITMDDGTQCEFYELPFIYLSFFLCLKILKGVSGSLKWRCFWIGASFGFVFLIRINDALLGIGVPYFMLFVYFLLKRDYRAVTTTIVYFILGVLAAVAPFVIYFLCKGILADVWFGSVLFNISYLAISKSSFGFSFLKLLILTFLALCTLPIFREKKFALEVRYLILPLLVASIFGIGSNPFTHYFMILMPVVALICTLNQSRLVNAVMLWVFGVSGWNAILGYVPFAPLQGSLVYVTYHRYKDFSERAYYEEKYSKFSSLINNVPEEDLNNIWNHNSFSINEVYSINNITPKNVYFFPTHQHVVKSMEEKNDFKNYNPEWLVTESSEDVLFPVNRVDSIYIALNYDAVDSVQWETVKVKLFKKKDNKEIISHP